MKSWTACINYRARRKDARRIGKKNERERESGRDGVGSAAGQGRANGISGQFSWAESRNRGCIFTGVLIWLETYYDRACNAALGARVIWYICFAYRIAREAVPEEESAVVAGDERNDGGGEKESEKVCSNTNVFAFHNKLRTHGTTTTARNPPLPKSTGLGIDGICLYLFERCATNYACLLRNAQFVRTLRIYIAKCASIFARNDRWVDIFVLSFHADRFFPLIIL